MNYFLSDIKKMYKNNIIRILFFFLLTIMIFDPISVWWQGIQNPNLFDETGKNAFQYWLLINSSNWGYIIYNNLFWMFPPLVTGLVFYNEKISSVFTLLIVRGNKNKYILSKIVATFVFSLVIFLLVFSINLLVTYLIFPADAVITKYYNFLIPDEGTFVYKIFQKSPFLMALAYVILNSVVIAIFSIFALACHMIFKFRNKYVAIVAPIIVLYASAFIFDSTTALFKYNINMIIQPAAANALTTIITANNVAITLLMWVLIDIILIIIGYARNKDML